MKRVPLALAVLLFLAVLSFINYTVITNYSEKIADNIRISIKSVEDGEYDKAYEALKDGEKFYVSHNSYFGAVVKHCELDNAVLSFSRLYASLDIRDKETFIEEGSYLVKILEHIGEMESLSIRNVF